MRNFTTDEKYKFFEFNHVGERLEILPPWDIACGKCESSVKFDIYNKARE